MTVPRRLTHLEETARDRARSAVEAGDQETALREIDAILEEACLIHDVSGDLTAALLTFIGERMGEEAIEQAWRFAGELAWRPGFEQLQAEGDTERLMHAMLEALISHRYEFELWEHEDRWVFEVTYCTSSERMVLEGKVADNATDREGHHRFGATSRAYPWSFGLRHLPYYDVHSALWHKLMPAEWGWDVLDVEYEAKAHGYVAPARYIVFKAPRKH